MGEAYTYAVARIRALESSLFSNNTIDQLIAVPDYDGCIKFLLDKGWGNADIAPTGEAILKAEQDKVWQEVKELGIPLDKFEVLFLPKEYHNLKAAIKEMYTSETHANIFYDDTKIPGHEMVEIVREKNFGKLPGNMQDAAAEAYESFMHTRDGQLCDIIVDRACLEAIYKAGKESSDQIIKDYADDTVAVADIKIAVRCQKTKKPIDFMRRAMADCGSISVNQLANAALNGMESIIEYLQGTIYKEGAEALKVSQSAFERWCDDRIIQTIKPQKYNTFTVGPVIAYVIARQTEIKTVRVILSGKQNLLPDESIRERVREMYV